MMKHLGCRHRDQRRRQPGDLQSRRSAWTRVRIPLGPPSRGSQRITCLADAVSARDAL